MVFIFDKILAKVLKIKKLVKKARYLAQICFSLILFRSFITIETDEKQRYLNLIILSRLYG